MQIIIAEKPSLARTVVQALSGKENFDRKQGYFEGQETIVTYAYGHLFQLRDMGEYTGETAWKLEGLPFVPEKFKFRLKTSKDKAKDDSVKQQYETIRELIGREDVDAVVNCGDSDREGQVIGDLIIHNALGQLKQKKAVYRLWLPEQTEDTIRHAIKTMKLDEEYQNLFHEGLARTYMDWLLGINLTRFLSVKLNHFMPVGRVLIPIVKIIYDRDMEIRNFKPEKYFVLESNAETNGEAVKLTFKEKYAGKEDCQSMQEYLNGQKAAVIKVEQKDIIKRASKLFSLSTLQSRLSKLHKMTLADSLKIIQGLYEKGFVTYPRTNSEYLSEAEKGKVEAIIAKLNGEQPYLAMKDSKGIFDDSKIESHSALIITNKFPKADELGADEQLVYDTIKNRFICNFLIEETVMSRTCMEIAVGKENFELKGDAVKQPGFLKYEPLTKKESILPNLNEGDEVAVDFQPVEKETTPPAKFDISMLSNYLKNPFRDELKEADGEAGEAEDDAAEYRAMLAGVEIGTEATRTGIIENAKHASYISEKNTKLSIEPMGEKLIESLDKLHINLYKEKTVEFSKLLKQVFHGDTEVQECVDFTAKELRSIVDGGTAVTLEQIAPAEKEVIGKCPRCGKNIYESTKAFYCSGFKAEPKCNFTMWKKDKFWESRGKKLTKTMAIKMLQGSKVKVKGLKKKSGDGTYDAYISMVDTGKWVNYEMTFEK